MGRPKLPLELQKGNLTKEQQVEKELEEDLVRANSNQLDKPPLWLRDKVAKKEWKRLVEQFRSISIISNLDLNNLAAYCNAYSCYLETVKELQGKSLVVEYTNKSGATNVVENPLIKIQMKYSDEMRKYSALLGLSVDSRLKLSSLKLKETKSEIKDEFGDI